MHESEHGAEKTLKKPEQPNVGTEKKIAGYTHTQQTVAHGNKKIERNGMPNGALMNFAKDGVCSEHRTNIHQNKNQNKKNGGAHIERKTRKRLEHKGVPDISQKNENPEGVKKKKENIVVLGAAHGD